MRPVHNNAVFYLFNCWMSLVVAGELPHHLTIYYPLCIYFDIFFLAKSFSRGMSLITNLYNCHLSRTY